MTEQGGSPAEALARVQVELATAAADATPLADLSPTVRDLTRVQPLLEQVLVGVLDILGADRGAVWVTDPVVQELYPAAWRGLPDDYMLSLRVPFGSGTVGRAITSREPVLYRDVAEEPSYAPFLEDAHRFGIVTAFSVPMLTLAGAAMGALTVYYSTPTEPAERARGLVDLYARQAAEIVERARMHGEALQLAELQRRRTTQLRSLAEAAIALSSAESVDSLLRMVTEAARDIVGAHQGVATRLRDGWVNATTYVSLSDEYAGYRDYGVVPQGLGLVEYPIRENRPLRLDQEQMRVHPDYRWLRDAPGHPPLPTYLAAPLIGRSGTNLGLIQLSHRYDDEPFSEEDEAILVQLGQMASSAIESLESLDRERAARQEAEAAAAAQSALSEASSRFAALLDPDEVVRVLVDVAVPRLGDLALVHVVDPDDHVRLAAFRCSDPQLAAVAEEFFSRFPVTASQPYGAGRVLATGEAQLLPQITDDILIAVADDATQAELLRRVVYRSGMSVPLLARGRSLGVLSFSRDEAYTEREIAYGADLASRAALALDNATRYAFERGLAGALQRSLLPRSTFASPLLTTAARYLPGAQGTQIGGDWYDVIEVADGRLVVVVGDVMGHGVQAAAVMGQLRAAVRAYALEGHEPAALLVRLDRVVQALDELSFTTCLIGLLDPVTRQLCLASAGHLPPVVITSDGRASYPELEPGLPLGVGGAQFVEQSVELEPGSTVLLYTDGLVEGRSLPVEEGMARLLAVAEGEVRSAEELCDRLLRALVDSEGHEDDTAMLALLLDDVTASAGASPLLLELPASPESAMAARTALAGMLGDETGPAAGVAGLLLTELVSNAVRHAGGELVVLARLRARLLLVEVRDTSERMPVRLPGLRVDAEGGRGVLLIDELADRWGAEPLPTGKRVWFELSLDSKRSVPTGT